MLNLLPIGSIVTVEGGSKKLMIYGRKQTDAGTQKEFDYLACPYPEGFISPKLTYMFNHSNIQEVAFKGFKDEDETKFIQALSDFYEKSSAKE